MSRILLEAAAVFTAALILITALAWNNVSQELFRRINPFKDPFASSLTYAIVVTIVAVFLLAVLEPYQRQVDSVEFLWTPT